MKKWCSHLPGQYHQFSLIHLLKFSGVYTRKFLKLSRKVRGSLLYSMYQTTLQNIHLLNSAANVLGHFLDCRPFPLYLMSVISCQYAKKIQETPGISNGNSKNAEA